MAETNGSGMVERVARAIALQDCCDPDFIDTMGRVQWTYHIDLARAAITAMREPSPEMVDKAWAMIGSNLRYEEVYGHLIDAALELPHPAIADPA